MTSCSCCRSNSFARQTCPNQVAALQRSNFCVPVDLVETDCHPTCDDPESFWYPPILVRGKPAAFVDRQWSVVVQAGSRSWRRTWGELVKCPLASGHERASSGPFSSSAIACHTLQRSWLSCPGHPLLWLWRCGTCRRLRRRCDRWASFCRLSYPSAPTCSYQ